MGYPVQGRFSDGAREWGSKFGLPILESLRYGGWGAPWGGVPVCFPLPRIMAWWVNTWGDGPRTRDTKDTSGQEIQELFAEKAFRLWCARSGATNPDGSALDLGDVQAPLQNYKQHASAWSNAESWYLRRMRSVVEGLSQVADCTGDEFVLVHAPGAWRAGPPKGSRRKLKAIHVSSGLHLGRQSNEVVLKALETVAGKAEVESVKTTGFDATFALVMNKKKKSRDMSHKDQLSRMLQEQQQGFMTWCKKSGATFTDGQALPLTEWSLTSERMRNASLWRARKLRNVHRDLQAISHCMSDQFGFISAASEFSSKRSDWIYAVQSQFHPHQGNCDLILETLEAAAAADEKMTQEASKTAAKELVKRLRKKYACLMRRLEKQKRYYAKGIFPFPQILRTQRRLQRAKEELDDARLNSGLTEEAEPEEAVEVESSSESESDFGSKPSRSDSESESEVVE